MLEKKKMNMLRLKTKTSQSRTHSRISARTATMSSNPKNQARIEPPSMFFFENHGNENKVITTNLQIKNNFKLQGESQQKKIRRIKYGGELF